MCLWCSDEAAAAQESVEVNPADRQVKNFISNVLISCILYYPKDAGERFGESGGKRQHKPV